MRAFRPIFAIVALASLAACDLNTAPNVPAPIDPANDTYAPSLGVDIASMTKTSSGLYYKDKVVGTGDDVAAAAGDSVRVDYTLWLTNGAKVESSKDTGRTPFEFKIGDPDLIPGFSEGFIGMKIGGARQLVVPTQLAWGSQGRSPVQPNANVVFDIELLAKF